MARSHDLSKPDLKKKKTKQNNQSPEQPKDLALRKDSMMLAAGAHRTWLIGKRRQGENYKMNGNPMQIFF